MKGNYPLWTELPYAGESRPPQKGVEPLAGSWKTYFIRNNKDGTGFKTLNGHNIQFKIVDPNKIDLFQQLKIVQRTLINLSEKEIEIAKYWGSGPPSKQWLPIADILIDTYGVAALRAGRILGALFAGINDAFIVTWYLKYKWIVTRPNQLDPTLATVICTPKHPSYPSGHSTVSGAAEVILSYFFPAERRRLRELAEEAARSRLYAGIHYPIDNSEGLKLGRQIGQIIINELQQQKDSRGDKIDLPFKEYRNAKLLPPPYEQAIPFDFISPCDSLLLNLQKTVDLNNNYNHRKNNTPSKPKLYLN